MTLSVRNATSCGLALGVRRNAGAQLDPTSFSGLICWISAGDLSGLSDGDTLPATITDLSGVGNDATRVSAPKYRTANTPNGSPAMSAESAGYLTLPNGMWTGKTAGHLFAYVKAPASGAVSGPWQIGGNDYTFMAYAGASDAYEGALTGTRYSFTNSLAVRDTWRIWEVVADGTDYAVRIDGVDQTTQTVAFTAPSASRILANTFSTVDVRIADFIAYDRDLTAGEASSVRQYLEARNGATG